MALFSNESFSVLNTADGLGHNETFSLLSDNDNIWVGTFGGGVSYLNDDQWFTLDTKDGLIGNTVGSIARLKDDSFLEAKDFFRQKKELDSEKVYHHLGLYIFTKDALKLSLIHI